MRLTVNGEAHEHEGDGTLAALLVEIGVEIGRVAVMINGEVIRGKDPNEVALEEGDKVEALTFAGGG